MHGGREHEKRMGMLGHRPGPKSLQQPWATLALCRCAASTEQRQCTDTCSRHTAELLRANAQSGVVSKWVQQPLSGRASVMLPYQMLRDLEWSTYQRLITGQVGAIEYNQGKQ